MTSSTNNENGVTLDDLAVMVKGGFDSMTDQMKKGFDKNERAHEDITLRLDNVAYRFELVELQKRVEVLEKTVGVQK